MKNNKVRAGIASVVLAFGLLLTTHVSWATNVSFEAGRVSNVGNDAVIVKVNEMGPTSRTAVLNSNLCNAANAGGPSLALNRANTYYKELLALSLTAYLMPKPFQMIVDDTNCNVINIQFLDRAPN